MGAFARSTTQYCTFKKRWDSDGKVWIQAQAHGTLVAKTPYQIVANEFGNLSQAIADEETYCYVGCPQAAAAIAAILWFQIGGYISDMVTTSDNFAVGHGIRRHNGTIICIDADFSGAAGEFAVAAVAGTGVAVIDAMLVPERTVGTT